MDDSTKLTTLASLPCHDDPQQVAPPNTQQEEQHLLNSQVKADAREGTGEGQPTEVKDNSAGLRLRLGSKLMLVVGMIGVEAGISYEALFLIPVLQTLGMPLRLASMTGFISGPLGTVLVPLLGWLSDRGSRPHRRKMCVVLNAVFVLILGLVLVVVACSVYRHPHRSEFTVYNNSGVNISRESGMWPSDNHPNPIKNSTTYTVSNSSVDSHLNVALERQNHSLLNRSSVENTAGVQQNSSHDDEWDRDLTMAGLSMGGFILFELGYDQTVVYVRSWFVTCTSRSEHTSILAIAMIVAALGGMTNPALGRVDFPAMFNLGSSHGASHPALLIQAAIQACITILLIMVGMTFTFLTGRRLGGRKVARVTMIVSDSDITPGADSSDNHKFVSKVVEKDAQDPDGEADARAAQHDTKVKAEVVENSCTQDGPPDSLLLQQGDEASTKTSVSHGQDLVASGECHVPGQDKAKELDGDLDTAVRTTSNSGRCCRRDCCYSPYRTLAFICVAAYFTFGTIYLFNYMISDYVGKAVYGGDPHADAGSESVGLYTAGVRTAAWGFLTHSVVYLLINLVHMRILALLGYKLEFVLVQLLTGGSMVLLALTARLELFFLLSVAVGFHRSCLYVVPFAAANDVVQTMATQSQTTGGQPRVGMAMSAVGAMIPLSYTTLFPWVGPLTEVMGSHSTPLWVGAFFSCLAAAGFMFVKTDGGPKCRRKV